MAEAFLSLAARDRKDILESAAAQLGRPAFILEKDIWLCWVPADPFLPYPAIIRWFSKAAPRSRRSNGIIDRFSEDVDITLDYKTFDYDFDPFAPDASKSRIRRFSQCLKSSVAGYLQDVVGPGPGGCGCRSRNIRPAHRQDRR